MRTWKWVGQVGRCKRFNQGGRYPRLTLSRLPLIAGWVLVAVLGVSSTSFAQSKDDPFLAARDAFRLGDLNRFESAAMQVASSHPLYPYMETWRFRLNQPPAQNAAWPEATVQVLMDRYAGSLAAESLRRDYLLNLARRQDWATFKREWSKLLTRDDQGLQCLGLASDLAGGFEVMPKARPLLMMSKELPEGCVLLGERMIAAGQLTVADLMQRVRVLTEINQRGLARRVYEYVGVVPGADTPVDLAGFDMAYERPSQYLAKLPEQLTPVRQELIAIALARLAREGADDAVRWLVDQRVGNRLTDNQRQWVWSQVALHAARRWHPRALEWFALSSPGVRTDDAHEWYARMALLAQQQALPAHSMKKVESMLGRSGWSLVQQVIDEMPPGLKAEPVWVYWQARALHGQGDTELARKLYLLIASPFHFYGKLSMEELALPVRLPPAPTPLTEAELSFAAANQGFKRALRWFELGQRTEGVREFNFSLAGMTDRQLLAAAEWAKRQELYDRAIAAADRTTQEHDVSLRLLTPYREALQAQSQLSGIDPAWAYGLIRQESRFIVVAKSHVGASGLMQLMPATASLVAKKIGMTDFSPKRVNEIDVNLQLGTAYLRMMLDQLDNSHLLASAAYNAGPGRPRDWRARLTSGAMVEGAVFAEAIPFNETRDYVKKVLSNATLYSAMFEQKPQSLKARLGMVSGRRAELVSQQMP